MDPDVIDTAQPERALESRTRSAATATGGAPVGSEVRAETKAEDVACPEGCGRSVRFEQVRVFDRWMPPSPGPCMVCKREAERQEEAKVEADMQDDRRRERERREKIILGLLDQAGASPWEHGHCTFENFDDSGCGPAPVEAAREFVRAVLAADTYDPVAGLYLSGPTGAGKSHLATAIARELLLNPSIPHDSVVFDPADVLVSRIRSLYGGKGNVDAFLRRRENARVWILDDLGREPPHPDVVGHLTMLISQRSKRGTVITGNLEPEQYEDRHPDLARVGSRLGPAYFRMVPVKGRDRRFDKRDT